MNDQKIIFKGGKLHPDQIKCWKNIQESKAMYHTIVTGRQWGKSFFAVQLLLYYALNNSNSEVMFVTLSHRQGSKIYNQLMRGIEHTKVVTKKNGLENSITLINGSQIYFVSVQQPENLLGYSIDYLFVDEAALIKDDTFNQVLRPFLRVRGKKCFLFSTPRGKNYFYKMYALGTNPEESYYNSFKGDVYGNPFSNLEELEAARKSLPDSIFRSEYLAEFVDGGSVFANLSENATLKSWQEPTNERYYAGIDIGITNDFLVMTVLNSRSEVVYCYRDNKKSMPYMIEEIKKVLNKYKPKKTYVETNGIGNGIYDYIAKLHKSVNPFVTSNDSKQEIIEDIIYAFQNGELKIPHKDFFPFYMDELSDFGFTYSPKTRKVIYNSVTGHDDTVMSLAIAYHALKYGASKGIYNII